MHGRHGQPQALLISCIARALVHVSRECKEPQHLGYVYARHGFMSAPWLRELSMIISSNKPEELEGM